MLAVKATSKKDSLWWWMSAWYQSRDEAETLKVNAKEIFGEDWNVEVISQEPMKPE